MKKISYFYLDRTDRKVYKSICVNSKISLNELNIKLMHIHSKKREKFLYFIN